MKKKELKDLETKTIQELQGLRGQKKAEVGKLGPELASGKHKNAHVVKNARRDLAQIATILRQKESEQK